MDSLRPRKLPRQTRSKATVAAIIEGAARILRELGSASLTTNRIAERAGVSIGSLYEFFPNRESIIAALAEERLMLLAREVESDLDAALKLDGIDAMRLLISRLAAAMAADREIYRMLQREAPAVWDLPEVQRALEAVYEVARRATRRAQARVDLPEPDADIWLVGRMVGNAVLEIAFADPAPEQKDRLIDELSRLTLRMVSRERCAPIP